MTQTQRQIEAHRQGEARILVHDAAGQPRAGVPVWAEQESHAFVFACVAPDLRQRGTDRLNELFNRILPADPPAERGTVRVEVPDRVILGRLRVDLDQAAAAAAGLPLEVHVRGACVGLGPAGTDADDRAAAERVAALYTLGFAHPAVCGIVWHGFWSGEAVGGLLRPDGSPRPAYRYLHKLIDTIWHSRAAGETDAAGLFHFRGFFGDYRVAARIGEEEATIGRFALSNSGRAGGVSPLVL